MKIKIEKLHINNFKGIFNFTLNLEKNNASITGKNATGKTTIADAWYWLISGKDGDQQSNFNILPLDLDGNPVKKEEATVIADLFIDRKKLQLKKVYKQKWTKKRGSLEKEFTGNTTDHFIDEIYVSAKEYSDKISSIIDEKLFRILSDVRFFCKLPSETKRKHLIDLIGNILPEDIIATDSELKELDSILSERDIEDHKKILTARKKVCTESLKGIPERIEENKLNINDIEENEEDIEKEAEEINSKIKEKIDELGRIYSGNEIVVIENQILELQKNEKQLEIDTKKTNFEKISKKLEEKSKLEMLIRTASNAVNALNYDISDIDEKIVNLNVHRDEAIKLWKETKSKKLVNEEVCFNCGQQLPESIIINQIESFNIKKAEELKAVNDAGKKITDTISKSKNKIEYILKEINDYNSKIFEYKSKIVEIDKDIHNINNSNNIDYSKKQIDISRSLKELNSKMSELDSFKNPLKEEINKLEDKKIILLNKLNIINRNKEAKERIELLQKNLKEISQEYQNLEHGLYLIEKFEQKKSEYIENNVSEKFSITKWKLFEHQINGGIRDICEPLYNGVPYSTDLNNGARILVGIDCINTLSRHYDISVPVFIDNAESLSDLIKIKHQYITLSVSKNDLEVNYL